MLQLTAASRKPRDLGRCDAPPYHAPAHSFRRSTMHVIRRLFRDIKQAACSFVQGGFGGGNLELELVAARAQRGLPPFEFGNLALRRFQRGG